MHRLHSLTPYLYAAIGIIIYAMPIIFAVSGTISAYLAILAYRLAKRDGKPQKGTVMFAIRAILYLGVAIFLAKTLYFH